MIEDVGDAKIAKPIQWQETRKWLYCERYFQLINNFYRYDFIRNLGCIFRNKIDCSTSTLPDSLAITYTTTDKIINKYV